MSPLCTRRSEGRARVLLKPEIVTGPDEAAARFSGVLGEDVGETAFPILRVRRVNGGRIVHERIVLPPSCFPGWQSGRSCRTPFTCYISRLGGSPWCAPARVSAPMPRHSASRKLRPSGTFLLNAV